MGSWFSAMRKLNCCTEATEDSKIEVNLAKTPHNAEPATHLDLEEAEIIPKPASDSHQPMRSHSSTARSSLAIHFDISSILNEEEQAEEVDSTEHVYRFGGRYIGQVAAGKRHGAGAMRWNELVEYTGTWREGLPKGEGKMTFEGHVFQGVWEDAQAAGSIEVLEIGLDSLEPWLEAYNEGYCKAYLVWLWYLQRGRSEPEAQILTEIQLYQILERKTQAIHTLMEAADLAIQKHPETLRFHTSNGYFGSARDGKPHGIGRKVFNASCFYEGEWADGQMSGAGVYQWNAQKVRKGFFKQGKFDGLTALISQGNTTFSWWQDGKEVRPLVLPSPSLS